MNDLDKFNKLKTIKEKTEKKKTNVFNAASELYNDLLGIYFDEYYELPNAKKEKIESKYDPTELFLKPYNCDVWFENEESSDKEESTEKEESIDLKEGKN